MRFESALLVEQLGLHLLLSILAVLGLVIELHEFAVTLIPHSMSSIRAQRGSG